MNKILDMEIVDLGNWDNEFEIRIKGSLLQCEDRRQEILTNQKIVERLKEKKRELYETSINIKIHYHDYEVLELLESILEGKTE